MLYKSSKRNWHSVKNKGRLAYSTKSYNNPFFKNNKKLKKSRKAARELSKKFKIIIFLIFVFIIAAAWSIFYSGFFKIKNIIVEGEGRIDPKFIEQLSWDFVNKGFYIIIPQDNIFIFNNNKLKLVLLEKYAFNDLQIIKKLPNTVKIKFNEKSYAMIWQENGNYYYADSNGYIIDEVNLLEVKQKDYPIVENASVQIIKKKQVSVEPAYLNYILNLFKHLRDLEDFKIDRFKIDNEKSTVKIILQDGPEIYFSITRDMDDQIEKLLVIKREKLQDDFNSKTYLDLRIGNSVYYR